MDWSSDVCFSDLVANDVLPMPGRPERISKSEGCNPPILALTESSPVVIPETLPPESSARSAILTASVVACAKVLTAFAARSEEHTSELQSLMRISYAVFCLKKKKTVEITEPYTLRYR